MVRFLLIILLTCLTLTLTGCFGDKHTITLARIDNTPKETRGVVRVMERKKIKTVIDSGEERKQNPTGITELVPGDIIITEQDLVKLVNMARKYNALKKKIEDMVKAGQMSVDTSNKLLGD